MELQQVVENGLADVRAKVDSKLSGLDADFKKISDRLQDIEQKGVHLSTSLTAGASSRVEAAVKKAVGSDAFKAFKAGAMTSGPIELNIEIKALTSLPGSPATPQAGVDTPAENLGVMTQQLRPLRVLDALDVRPATGNTIGFNRLSLVGDEKADYQEGEGTEKSEAELAAAWSEAPVVTIAVHTTLSKQVLEDVSQLEQAVENLLRYALANKVDLELMIGDGAAFHIDGLLTQATAYTATATATAAADRIGQAGASLRGAGYSPSVVFVNPADWFTIESERAVGDGHYIGGGWNAPAVPNIYGMTVIPTASMPVGEALVMDPSVAVVGMRQSPTVEGSREHNGNWTKNLVTILAEVRLGLVVTDPAGLLQVDLTP